jgi:predicted nucleic acid-binding protein
VSVLLDTNVLLRRLETAHPHHAAAIAAVDRLLRSGEPAVVTLQNLTEAWRVMTAPAGSNGFGRGPRR